MIGEDVVHRPIGDLLEEILSRGAPAIPNYIAHLPVSPLHYRIAVLLGVLGIGPEVVEVVRERVRRRDSPEKWATMRGLGELGHPEAEGYFTRVLRERSSVEASITALQSLGRIRGRRSLGLIVGALGEAYLLPSGCEALAAFATPEAVDALERCIAELPAFRALASLGAGCARDAFVVGLERDPEWAGAAARGIGGLGEPDLAGLLLPHLKDKNPEVRRAAFEAYARLGAPQGSGPLLDVAQRGTEPWMIPALGGLADDAVHEYLVGELEGAQRRGLLKRLFSRRRVGRDEDRRAVARALRGATTPRVLEQIGVLLLDETDPVVARHLLGVRGLLEVARQRDRVAEVWRRGDPLLAHVAGVALLQNPTRPFLGEVLEFLSAPGFRELDHAPVGADPEHLLAVYARDNNPALLLGAFADSGFLDLEHLVEALRGRVTAWAFPSAAAPNGRFGRPEDGQVGAFLQSLGAAHPDKQEALWRLWDLLAQLDAQGDSLLDLFLSHSGAHRGGMQRALFAGFSSAMAKFIVGRGDRDLPELDAIASHLPAEGPLLRPLREVFERARTALKAECRDITLVVEGSTRGDLVMIEKL